MKTINLEDFGDELKDFAQASLAKKKAATIAGIVKSLPDLVAASPVDTGLYAASWDFTVTETSAIIGNYAPYAGIIENGARPFTPPIGPLLNWAKRVLQGGGGQDTGEMDSNYSPEVWALAKYTQKKISEHGMTPRHILENMIPTIIKNIKEEYARAS